MMVTPHLKTVLKDYQHSAVKSLHGPAHHLHPPFAPPPPPSPLTVSSAAGTYEEDACSPAAVGVPASYVPPLPVQQLPILTTSDTSSSDLCFTQLEDVSISCFSVGGEKRLCLPQVLQSVLGDFTLAQINNQCDNLLIYCSRCTPEQLNVLKGQGILPSSAFSCGLITKSDAERLCSALLYSRAKSTSTSTTATPATAARIKKEPATLPSYDSNVEAHNPISKSTTVKSEDGERDLKGRLNGSARTTKPTPRGGRVFRVRHECFGRAVGILHEALYDAKQAKCIECVECKGWHSPQQFVKHVHWQNARGESRTVHWGFDSANWRYYLLPLSGPVGVGGNDEECCGRQPTDEADADCVLDLMRDRYEGVAPFAAYDGGVSDKAEIKKEVNGNGAPTKEWNMSLKRKLLHQVTKSSTTPPPRPPPSPPPIKRDTSSPMFATKKAKLIGEEYILMAQQYHTPIDTYLSPAVFQQFSPFRYTGLSPHSLPLGVGHQSAKEAKLRQAIAESNTDLTTRVAHPADDPPPTPKKQRLIRHLQDQRRKLEEVQKSPDSTTVPTTPIVVPIERKYSEIDLSTTDTEDTGSEGTASAHSDPPKPALDVPRPLDTSADVSAVVPPPVTPELETLHALFAANPHPDKCRITDMFRRLLDERAAKDDRINMLETQLKEASNRARGRSPETTDRDDTPVGDSKQIQSDYKSVITLPARPSIDDDAIIEDGEGGGDAATSTSLDDAKPHCPSASVPATT